MSIRFAATGGAKQVPGHIEYSRARGTQEHLKHCTTTLIPMISERIRSDPLEGQVISLIKKSFEPRDQPWICALLGKRLTQRLEAGATTRAETTLIPDLDQRSTFGAVHYAVIQTEGSLKTSLGNDPNRKGNTQLCKD